MTKILSVFTDTLKKSRGGIAVFCLSLFCSFAVFYLYRLPLEPFVYAFLLVAVIGAVLFFVTFYKGFSKAEMREEMINSVLCNGKIPPADTLAEKDYGRAITLLRNELSDIKDEFESARQDEADYYNVWVHQIKTPISVIRMEIGGMTSENTGILEAELFRIEQYADMVLQYQRLGSGNNDLVIKEYGLDGILRESIRKFAALFVSKKLKLCYDGTDLTVITDKKWFALILEQLISNAIKYTPSGSISICVENGILSICDTGIGIAPDDIPRIFEKGYTGENGRLCKRSSGLGLYLCKKSADMLCIPLSVESTVGKGSTFFLDLRHTARI